MNEYPPNSQGRSAVLERACGAERMRIHALAGAEKAPDGDFLHPVFGTGNVDAHTMLIGEAPGGEEAASGTPFVGKAGKQLDTLLASISLDRRDVYITNAVKYRPVVRGARTVRNRTPLKSEVSASLPLLETELRTVAPAVVVTLGNTPLHAVMALCGVDGDVIGSLHGQAILMQAWGTHFTLFPLYHPASGIYNSALIPVMAADIRALSAILPK